MHHLLCKFREIFLIKDFHCKFSTAPKIDRSSRAVSCNYRKKKCCYRVLCFALLCSHFICLSYNCFTLSNLRLNSFYWSKNGEKITQFSSIKSYIKVFVVLENEWKIRLQNHPLVSYLFSTEFQLCFVYNFICSCFDSIKYLN